MATIETNDRARQRVVVERQTFPEVIDRLKKHFVVVDNQADATWSVEEFVQKLDGAAGAITLGAHKVDAALVAQCPALRICANMMAGYDNLDIKALSDANILATNTPDVLTETTADGAFALLMATARRIVEADGYLRAGKWKKWTYDMLLGNDIHGKTLGIVGMGRIGRAVARRAGLGFDMRILYHNRNPLPANVAAAAAHAEYADLDVLLKNSDYVMIATPLSNETRHLIGEQQLGMMKPDAIIVNIGRGGIIDEVALLEALQKGTIAGAGLDVFEKEPFSHWELAKCQNVVLTPHIGSASRPTRLAMANLAADNVIGYLLEGKAATPLNLAELRNAR